MFVAEKQFQFFLNKPIEKWYEYGKHTHTQPPHPPTDYELLKQFIKGQLIDIIDIRL